MKDIHSYYIVPLSEEFRSVIWLFIRRGTFSGFLNFLRLHTKKISRFAVNELQTPILDQLVFSNLVYIGKDTFIAGHARL